VYFETKSENVDWITTALRTITHEHRDFEQVSISVPSIGADIRQVIGEAACRQWLDLDHLLVKFWESHSIHPAVKCRTPIGEGQDMMGCIGLLMPEVVRKGIVHLAE